MLSTSYFAGFSLGISLIVAIGAQNAFVLKQGIKRQYVLLICSLCVVSDAILILAGVAGFGAMVERFPSLETIARFGGAAFLLCYALMSFRSAIYQNHAIEAESENAASALKVALICLAFTWLNPHVYLDTVVLLGSLSTQYADKWVFGAGAVTGSTLFFFSLGYGARFLAPLFAKPVAWKWLEAGVGCTMLLIAISLVL